MVSAGVDIDEDYNVEYVMSRAGGQGRCASLSCLHFTYSHLGTEIALTPKQRAARLTTTGKWLIVLGRNPSGPCLGKKYVHSQDSEVGDSGS